MRIPTSLLTILLSLQLGATDLVLDHAAVQVFFSPHGGCTEAVVAAVDHSKRSILVQAYSFTSMPIAQALKGAHDRGVDVRVILDKSQRTDWRSDRAFVQAGGIPVWIDTVRGIAHSKVMVIDGDTVVTGSFNFTAAAEKSNAENLLVIRSETLAAAYTQNWNNRLARSIIAPTP